MLLIFIKLNFYFDKRVTGNWLYLRKTQKVFEPVKYLGCP